MEKQKTSFTKKAKKYNYLVLKKQKKFDDEVVSLIKSLLSNSTPQEMSSSLVESIEENAMLQYYYKLRLLALEQKGYFSGRKF